MQGQIPYNDHRRFLERQVRLVEAELRGFIQAACGGLVRYSPDPEQQRRFVRGYEDGKAKIIQDWESPT
jgi:hypothetical protein